MDKDIEERLERALSGYRRKREQFLAAQKNPQGGPATSTSQDRLVTVTVDVRGDVTALRFNSTGYASMDAADLAELIVATMAEARAKVRGQAGQAAEQPRPAPAGSGEAANGDGPWMRLLPRERAGGERGIRH